MNSIKITFLLLLFCAISIQSNAQLADSEFQNPPVEVKPKTWFHVMSANMSEEGLTKDIDAIAKAGIGGILMFNVTQGIPIGNVVYNSPEHHRLIQHAAAQCEKVGISFGVHNCDGWTSSGGPWITPENSMKFVVYSSTVVNGGKSVQQKLKQPTARHNFYKDIAVVAYPSLAAEIEDYTLKPVITSSDPKFDVSVVNDKLLDISSTLAKKNDLPSYITFDYGKNVIIRTIYLLQASRSEFILQKSDNGVDFTTVFTPTAFRTGKSEYGYSQSFAPVTARYFRVLADQTASILEINLSATQNINNALGRTSMNRTNFNSLEPIGNPDPEMIIDKSKVLDLTSFVDSTGTLKATLPAGNWTVMRFGYTTTGAVNVPSSKEGKGLEVDKFNKEALKIHYDAFVKKVVNTSKSISPNAFQYIEIDSYEVGGQNWTNNFLELFKNEYKYDLLQFLPLFAGRFVESAEATEAVLYDLRKLNSALMVSNYYGYFTELAHADGLKVYIEPYGFGPFNTLDAGGKADFTMGEFWLDKGTNITASAISSARIYGKKIISAESFTSESKNNWKGYPGMAKNMGDKIWTDGVNEFMFHRFVHQANTHVVPGMTMNRWGFHFDRTQTWWENAGKAWFTYMARGQYLLQQGIPASDFLVFIGEGAPNDVIKQIDKNFPKNYTFDCTNADVLLNRVQVINEKMTLPEGTSYKALILKNSEKMSLKLLERLNELSKKGVIVIGQKPVSIPGYMVSAEDKARFNKLVKEIWSRKISYSEFEWDKIFNIHKINPEFTTNAHLPVNFIKRKINNASIYFFYNPDSVELNIQCKFRTTGMIPEMWDANTGKITKIASWSENDGYCIVPVKLEVNESKFVVFREKPVGKHVIGANSNTLFSYNELNNIVANVSKSGKLIVELSDKSTITKKVTVPNLKNIEGAWKVTFGDKSYDFESLTDWKDNANEHIKYFSGTATYTNAFEMKSAEIKPNTKVWLNLGTVSIAARVIVNNQDMGVCWHNPYKIEITNALKKGTNHIKLEVTNQWTNRLIGDENYPDNSGYKNDKLNIPETKMVDWYVKNLPQPETKRTTFCTWDFYKKGDELISAGLKGPVTLSFTKNMEIK